MKFSAYAVVSGITWGVATGVMMVLGVPWEGAVVGGGLAATGLVYELSQRLKQPPKDPR